MIVNTFAGKLDVYEKDEYIRNHSMFGDIYEQHIILGPLKRIIEKSRYILDIGANNGNHTLAYSFLSPDDARVYSFEPQREVFKHLETTVALNEHTKKKVSLYNKAIGDSCRTETMNPITNVNIGGVGIGQGGERVDMCTIDSLTLPGCDYMKIDVEGYESHVIEGARETIKKYTPIIFFEHNSTNDRDTPFRLLSKTFGYMYFIYTDWDNWIAWHPKNPPEFPIHGCLPTRFY